MSLPVVSAFKSSRWFRRLVWILAAFLVYLIIGFFILPPVIKWQMHKRLPQITKRQTAIQQVRLNPLTLSLTIRGLALTEPEGRRFASWEEFYINFQASSLFRWAWTFKEIRLVQPFGEVILFKDGRLNFADMFGTDTNSPPRAPRKSGIVRLNIFHLQVTNGFVALEDQTRRSPFRTEYRPINLQLTRFTTRPNSDSPYSFRAESDAGRSVAWAGDLMVQPLGSQGRLEITGVKLSRYQPYLEDFTTAVLTNGLADIHLQYRFQAGTNGLDLAVTNCALHVEQIELQDPNSGEIVASLRGFDARQGQLDWRTRDARLGTVKVSEASLLARLQKNGRLNLLELLTIGSASTNAFAQEAKAPGSEVASPSWTMSVDDFEIAETAVVLEDLTHKTPFRTELKPVTVNVKHFTTRADADADYSFHITSEAAEKIDGAGIFCINPVRSSGEVKLEAVEVKKYHPFVEEFFRGQVSSGKLAVTVPYHSVLLTNGFQAGVSNLSLQLADLEVQAAGTDETVVRVAELGLSQVEASLDERRARVGLMKASGGMIVARREQDGSLNLQGLLAPASTNATSSASPSEASAGQTNGWNVIIAETALTDCSVRFEDRQLPKPAALLVDQLSLNIKNVSTDLSAPVQVLASLRLNETGTLGAQGVASLGSQSADFTLGLTNLDLLPFQSWLDEHLRVGIVSGALGANGRVRYDAKATTEPRVLFSGALSLTNFVCTDQVAFKEFARWEHLALSGIECGLEPTALKIAEVSWVAPKTTVLIGADRRPNFSLILKPGDTNVTNTPIQSSAQAAESSKPNPGTVPIQVDLVKLERASFAFTDESIQPRASIGIQQLSGTLKGLSSALNATADVDLVGRVDEQSPFSITGRINPLASNIFVDLIISNANTQLTPLTPYLQKYAGHPLNKGRLTTRLHYLVQDKQLKAENKIQIDQLTLGPRQESPDATSLPVKLAVALLKDNNGRIELDLPVHGALDDPQFSLGPIILKVLMNVMTKAVASPFKLLGALVGGGEELSFVSFIPGTTELREGEGDKLAKLAKALAQRPALSLEIGGSVDPVSDRQALAKQKLRDQLKANRLRELTSKGKATLSVETFQLAPEEYDQLLRASFAEKFGTNIAAILQTNQIALSATNQPAATSASKSKPSLYRRVTGLIGFDGNAGSKSKVEKRLPKADRLALRQMTPDLMEMLLAGQVEVTQEDFRELMDARARWIQEWLLQKGQVANERLLLVAPKSVAESYQGASQANLSLN